MAADTFCCLTDPMVLLDSLGRGIIVPVVTDEEHTLGDWENYGLPEQNGALLQTLVSTHRQMKRYLQTCHHTVSTKILLYLASA